MLLNYIFYKDGKMHYNTLAGIKVSEKWSFTDIFGDSYKLESEDEAIFVYDDTEGYYAIIAKATDTNIEDLKVLLFVYLEQHIKELESYVEECKQVQKIIKFNLGGTSKLCENLNE